MSELPIYEMIDKTPIWQHLAFNGEDIKIHLSEVYTSRIAEIVGKIYLKQHMRPIISNIFPDFEKFGVKRELFKNEYNKGSFGDYVVEVNYLKAGKYGKKMAIFEIKHGFIQINQNQLKRYCNWIMNPKELDRKANEVKVFFLLFREISTFKPGTAKFTLSELTPALAKEILDALPVEKYEYPHYRTDDGKEIKWQFILPTATIDAIMFKNSRGRGNGVNG